MDVFFRALNSALMILFPLALGVFLARRYRVDWRIFGLGALTFIAAQVLHIPFNQWVLNPIMARLGWAGSPGGLPYAAFAVSLGLSAGLFEETARYLVYRRGLRPAATWENGLMLGAGHGGIEAVLFGTLALYGLVQALALRGADLSAVVEPAQLPLAEAQIRAYWAAPWHLSLLGAVERLGALSAHLGLSILVLQAVTRRRVRWLLLAVAWHTALNAIALLILPNWGPYWTEAFVLLAGALSVWVAYRLRPPKPDRPAAPPGSAAPLERLSLDDLDTDQLEDSRYA